MYIIDHLLIAGGFNLFINDLNIVKIGSVFNEQEFQTSTIAQSIKQKEASIHLTNHTIS